MMKLSDRLRNWSQCVSLGPTKAEMLRAREQAVALEVAADPVACVAELEAEVTEIDKSRVHWREQAATVTTHNTELEAKVAELHGHITSIRNGGAISNRNMCEPRAACMVCGAEWHEGCLQEQEDGPEQVCPDCLGHARLHEPWEQPYHELTEEVARLREEIDTRANVDQRAGEWYIFSPLQADAHDAEVRADYVRELGEVLEECETVDTSTHLVSDGPRWEAHSVPLESVGENKEWQCDPDPLAAARALRDALRGEEDLPMCEGCECTPCRCLAPTAADAKEAGEDASDEG